MFISHQLDGAVLFVIIYGLKCDARANKQLENSFSQSFRHVWLPTYIRPLLPYRETEWPSRPYSLAKSVDNRLVPTSWTVGRSMRHDERNSFDTSNAEWCDQCIRAWQTPFIPHAALQSASSSSRATVYSRPHSLWSVHNTMEYPIERGGYCNLQTPNNQGVSSVASIIHRANRRGRTDQGRGLKSSRKNRKSPTTNYGPHFGELANSLPCSPPTPHHYFLFFFQMIPGWWYHVGLPLCKAYSTERVGNKQPAATSCSVLRVRAPGLLQRRKLVHSKMAFSFSHSNSFLVCFFCFFSMISWHKPITTSMRKNKNCITFVYQSNGCGQPFDRPFENQRANFLCWPSISFWFFLFFTLTNLTLMLQSVNW